MWLLVAPVTITVPWVRVRVFQLRLSPPRDRSHLSWERHQGVPQSPRPAWGQSCRPAGHSPTEHSWSSSRPPGKCTTAPPQLPSPAPPPAFPPADSPRAGPATNLVSPIWCHHRARVHGVGGCSGRGSVLREILIFHGCFCPPGTFLAAFPLTLSCLSCQAVLPTWWEHPQPWAVISKENPGEHCDTRETFAFSSPPARSQSPQPRFGSGWLSLPICPSRCALPPGSCLVHSPAVAPATSQTLT